MTPTLEPAVAPTWFDTPEKVAALRAAAGDWIGTPFFPNSEARGRDGGVDCVRLLNGINSDPRLALFPHQEIPVYPMDWGKHQDRSLLIEAFETWPALRARFCRLPANNVPPLPGDILAFKDGKVSHHGGQMLDQGEFIHALQPEGVYCMRLDAAFRGWRILGRLAAIFRPLP